MKKFEVGKHYRMPGLYGPSYTVKITARTESTVTFIELGFEAETISFDVDVDENNVERCLAWSYKEHEAYMTAAEPY